MTLAALSAVLLATAAPQTSHLDSVFAALPDVHAVRASGPITVDGVLSERVWQAAPAVTSFLQSDPDQGAPPSQRTEVRVAYDDEAIYVGARMYDDHPDSILARLARRDVSVAADRFALFLDPFHDRRNGYYFLINAAGTLYDGTLFNNDWDESSWDGVWEGKAKIDREGWTAEMRIPYSQLRFTRKDSYLWGVNFRRDLPRRNENDWLVFVPRNESGFVSRFVNLVGIEHVSPGRYFELLPYLTSKAEYLTHAPADPINDGSRYRGEAGADLRTGIGSNLTLNATMNPDFGQVEVDPAVVNLSDVETFFEEKRPFFVEGSTIYNFGNQGANNYWGFNWPEPKFFYTRRIGRSPQGSTDGADFVDRPSGTRILGATKLTGRVLDGWSVGTLHAVTQRTLADLSTGGARSRAEIEPLTYYGVERALKDFQGGRYGLGLMSTYAARRFQDGLRDQINRNALMGGVDGWVFLDPDKNWVISGWSVMSHVQGTRERMIALQRNAQHYFQRPDLPIRDQVDSTATSLTGFGTRLWLNKQNGNVTFNSAAGFMTPGFEVNDLGFQSRSGVTNAHVGGGYKWTTPGRFKKYSDVTVALFNSTDFQGDVLQPGVWAGSYTEFNNAYSWDKSVSYSPWHFTNRQTRGGPLMASPPGWNLNTYFDTDGKRKRFYFVSFGTGGASRGAWWWSVNPGVEWKPSASVVLRVGPQVDRSFDDSQYVGTYDDPLAVRTYGRRYVFAGLDQTTVQANLTLNWSFTPRLSLQLFAQPLIASGDYHDFMELARARSYEFLRYGTGGSTFDRDSVIADPDGAGPAPPIAIGNRDFNFRSLRGDAVLRWEFSPGSTLFLVWTQDRSDGESIGDLDLNHSVHRLLSADANNIFLAKVSYYFSM